MSGPEIPADPEGGQQRRGPFEVDTDQALGLIRLEWGGVYDTGYADGAYHAARIDGAGDLLTGKTPDELNAAIRSDWGTR